MRAVFCKHRSACETISVWFAWSSIHESADQRRRHPPLLRIALDPSKRPAGTAAHHCAWPTQPAIIHADVQYADINDGASFHGVPRCVVLAACLHVWCRHGGAGAGLLLAGCLAAGGLLLVLWAAALACARNSLLDRWCSSYNQWWCWRLEQASKRIFGHAALHMAECTWTACVRVIKL